MKLTRYILGIAGAAVLLSGCEELEKAQAYAPDSDKIILRFSQNFRHK